MRLSILLLAAGCAAPTPPGDTDVVEVLDELILDPAPSVVEVLTISGQVDVVVHEAATFEVTPTIATTGDTWGYTEEADGRLVLFPLCPNGSQGCSTGFSLRVPAGQPLEISTTSGKVALQATYAGPAVVATSTADVQGRALGAATLDIVTTDGLVDLEYEEVPVSLVTTTVSGDIDVLVPFGTYAVDMSSNGDMVLEGVQQGTGPSLTLTSTSGHIELIGYDPAAP